MTATTSLRERLFDFLTRRYVQSQDARQREMGLRYMTAETHDLADSLAAALSTPPAGEWMPIASAPKGELLLYWPATKPTRGAAGNTLHEMIRTGYAGGTPNRPPTHWQPLPPPPATQEVG